jgi:hypothetical protein
LTIVERTPAPVSVGDVQAEGGAVADGRADLVGGVPDDHADVGDAGRRDGLQAVEQDGLVGDGHELLGRGVGDRPQSGTGSAGEHESLHHASP